MKTMKSLEWVQAVEVSISDAISQCYPREWNEDHISYTWIRKLIGDLPHVHVSDSGRPFTVTWDAYKADGALEERYGDIAVIVRSTLRPGMDIEGVAFLEAKRRYDTGQFTKLDWDVTARHTSCCAIHRYLLYDFQPATGFQGNLNTQCVSRLPGNPYPNIHALCVPTPFLHRLQEKGTSLYRFGVPLGLQLCTRYLSGQELLFDPQLIDLVKRGASGGVRFVIVVHIGPDDGGGGGGTAPLNPNCYSRLSPSCHQTPVEVTHQNPQEDMARLIEEARNKILSKDRQQSWNDNTQDRNEPPQQMLHA